tara:strand:- start:374 stop:700 length:327 start_codon:yes stop_codon:yes gene_type:complete
MATNDLMVSDSLKGLFDEENRQPRSLISLVSPIKGTITKITKSASGTKYFILPDDPMFAFVLFAENNLEQLIFRYMDMEVVHNIPNALISIDNSQGKLLIQIESTHET